MDKIARTKEYLLSTCLAFVREIGPGFALADSSSRSICKSLHKAAFKDNLETATGLKCSFQNLTGTVRLLHIIHVPITLIISSFPGSDYSVFNLLNNLRVEYTQELPSSIRICFRVPVL